MWRIIVAKNHGLAGIHVLITILDLTRMVGIFDFSKIQPIAPSNTMEPAM
jgi:hypothetical protein